MRWVLESAWQHCKARQICALGNLVQFELRPACATINIQAEPLRRRSEFAGLMADKAFDANWIIADPTRFCAKPDTGFAALICLGAALKPHEESQRAIARGS